MRTITPQDRLLTITGIFLVVPGALNLGLGPGGWPLGPIFPAAGVVVGVTAVLGALWQPRRR